jgi:hypothetical protein
MENQVIAYERPQIADTGIIDEETLAVYCWRMEQLLQAGFTRMVADALADDGAADVRLACSLLSEGCPEREAYLIVS